MMTAPAVTVNRDSDSSTPQRRMRLGACRHNLLNAVRSIRAQAYNSRWGEGERTYLGGQLRLRLSRMFLSLILISAPLSSVIVASPVLFDSLPH